ncbi:hypothetical protein JCM8547_000277 [Rhodosporidiobolus lusitaniae]
MPRSPSLPRSTPGLPSSTTSTVLNHTIPQFYACYLLRSFNKVRGGTYIGSTPDPPRRFKQHSGEIKGGAFKTQRGRPWEMEGIVYGFPSKLQALQFEWAWQNPHASRHLHSPPALYSSFSSSSAAPAAPAAAKPTAQFPKSTLSNRPLTKIQVLQFMLTVPPWRSFNLRVLLFSEDAKGWWDEARQLGPVARTEAGVRKWRKEREKEGRAGEDPWGEVRGKALDGTEVRVRREGVDGKRLVREGKRKEEEAIERIRVDDHDFFDPHWAKWNELAESSPGLPLSCSICHKAVETEEHRSFFLCTSSSSLRASSSSTPVSPCNALFHLPCLASAFLSPSISTSTSATSLSLLPSPAPPSTRSSPFLPTSGPCPSCSSDLHWIDLVRASYRRKEEEEGTRKRRTFQKGSTDPLAKKRVRGESAATASQEAGAKGKGGGNKGKGKGKAVVEEDEDEEEGTEEEERFDFNDEDDDGEGEGSDADSVDLDGEEAEAQERSWAQLEAAEGGLADDDPFDFGGEGGMDVEGWENDYGVEGLPAVRRTSPDPPSPASPKKRGRPLKASKATSPYAPSPSPSPPRATTSAAPRRRTAASSSTSTAAAAKKPASEPLTSVFGSSKAGVSSLSTTSTATKKKAKPPVPLPTSDSEDDLLPLSAVGFEKGKGKATSVLASEKERAGVQTKRKKIAYVELSD